jgi:hypothetical protein
MLRRLYTDAHIVVGEAGLLGRDKLQKPVGLIKAVAIGGRKNAAGQKNLVRGQPRNCREFRACHPHQDIKESEPILQEKFSTAGALV